MSQLVGLHNGVDQTRNTILRPPILTVPAAAYPDGRIMRPANADYAQQTVQITDDMGNSASHVRIANGGYRTVQRVINIDLSDNAVHKIRLVNNVGTGQITFGRIDGIGAPAGFLKLLNDQDATAPFIMSPMMSLSLDANMHRLVIQGSGCVAGCYAIISYAMEIYISNVVFSEMPAIGAVISMGDYAIFEVYENGVPGTVKANHFGVEIPLSGLVTDFCDNLITAFNTTYIAAVEPAGSLIPFHWAKKIEATDLIRYRDSGGSWIDATDAGVQFNSVDAAMIRNTISSSNDATIQIIKQL